MPGPFGYNLNIPFASNKPSADQPLMLQNTNTIDTWNNIDHFSFSSSNAGYHNIVHQPPQVGKPGAIGGIGQLYTKTISGDQQLFFETGAGTETQITGLPSNFSANGSVTLIGGLILQWGFVNGTHGGDNHFNSGDTNAVPIALSFPNNCFGIIANPIYKHGNAPSSSTSEATIAIDNNLTKSGFTWTFITGSSSYIQFFWLAVGN